MIDLVQKLLMKNRTIVSGDNAECLRILQERYPLMVHSFASGTEHQTWPIPPEWNVKHAVLSDHSGVIASYEESPLFLAPYSQSFCGQVSREELLAHTMTNPGQPGAFSYEFRLAYNFQRRLKEWRITLPHARAPQLGAGPFQVDIDVEVRPGHMLIGESSHPGASGHWFTFLAHYCHVAQANDGLAGVVAMLELIERIKRAHPRPRHGYKALIMPETIGSSVYAAWREDEMDRTLGAAFSEMAGADAPIQLVASRRADTYIDRVFNQALRQHTQGPVRHVAFRNGWGNDELVFDSPGVGVPAVSLDRHPFAAYHTHFDDLKLVVPARLEDMIETLLAVVGLLERDFIPRPRQRVPVYLTRYNLYADWTKQRALYDQNAAVIDSLWCGLSVLDIALQHGLPPEPVFDYIEKFVELGLVEAIPVSPDYTRTQRFKLPER